MSDAPIHKLTPGQYWALQQFDGQKLFRFRNIYARTWPAVVPVSAKLVQSLIRLELLSRDLRVRRICVGLTERGRWFIETIKRHSGAAR